MDTFRTRRKARKNPFSDIPAGKLTKARAAFEDISHVDPASTAVRKPNTRSYAMVTGDTLVTNLPAAVTTEYWGIASATEVITGSWRLGLLTPSTYWPDPLVARGGQKCFHFPVPTGQTQMRVVPGAGFAGEILDAQLVDMAAVNAMPAWVVVLDGQSGIVGAGPATDRDPKQDNWSDPRLQYAPGAANTAYGTVLGRVTALISPLQQQAATGSALTANYITNGISPVGEFAKAILPYVPKTHRLVIIAAGVSGTGFADPQAGFNRNATIPFAWNHLTSLVASVMASLPVGSKIKMTLGSKFEAETSADMSAIRAPTLDFYQALDSFFTTNGYADAPVPHILINGPPDASRINQSVMLDFTRKLDQQSGHAWAISGVHVVDTGAWGVLDSTHRTSEAQRRAGKAAAALAIKRRLYL